MFCPPYDGHLFPVWLDCTLLIVDLFAGSNLFAARLGDGHWRLLIFRE